MTARRALVWLTGFLAVTATIGGGAILLDILGLNEADLDGSPFASYVVPGLALLVLVGGTATVAAIALRRSATSAPLVAAASGLAIVIFEIVQMRYIAFHPLQVAYLVVGGLIVALATRLWTRDAGHPGDGTRVAERGYDSGE